MTKTDFFPLNKFDHHLGGYFIDSKLMVWSLNHSRTIKMLKNGKHLFLNGQRILRSAFLANLRLYSPFIEFLSQYEPQPEQEEQEDTASNSPKKYFIAFLRDGKLYHPEQNIFQQYDTEEQAIKAIEILSTIHHNTTFAIYKLHGLAKRVGVQWTWV